MTPNEQTAVEAIRDFCREWIDVSCQADVVDRCQCLLCKRKRGLEAIALLEASPTVPVSRWIPVTERLPETPGRYLCGRFGLDKSWGDVNRRIIASYVKGTGGMMYWDNSDVTHWQLLPEAPQ